LTYINTDFSLTISYTLTIVANPDCPAYPAMLLATYCSTKYIFCMSSSIRLEALRITRTANSSCRWWKRL